MLRTSWSRLSQSFILVLPILLMGCGQQLRSVAPDTSGQRADLIRDASPSLVQNALPQATILSPAPDPVFTLFQPRPLRFEWTGQDPDGHLREYRYQVFGRKNPDFPQVPDFIAFMISEPEEVLGFYDSNKFEGWERLPVRKGSDGTATYSGLLGNETYAFVVVAIDNRGAHDATLTRERNIIQFAVAPQPTCPSLTFVTPFGQATLATDSDVASISVPSLPAGEPIRISWNATPLPGMVIEGYRSTLELGGVMQPTSLADTTITVSAPPVPIVARVFVFVEVQYDGGKRALYTLLLGFPGVP